MNDQEVHSYDSNPHVQEARQHMKEARAAMRRSWEALLPHGFVENRKEARKQTLLAMRSMIDAAIERTKS